MELADIIGTVTSVLTIVFMLSPVPSCLQITRNKSTENVSSTPFLAGIVNCGLWLNYGLLTGNPLIYVVCIIGAVLNVLYIGVFYAYCTTKRSFINSLLTITVSNLAFTGYTILIADHDFGEWLAGLVACGAAMMFVAAPLAELGTVMKTKSTAILPLPMVIGNTILSILNLWYGILLNDLFMTVPNIFGSIISIFTVSLFFVYSSKPPSKKE